MHKSLTRTAFKSLKTLNSSSVLLLSQALPDAGKERERRLLYWFIEDAVKLRYAMLVEALEECTRDNLEFIKERASKVSPFHEGEGRQGGRQGGEPVAWRCSAGHVLGEVSP